MSFTPNKRKKKHFTQLRKIQTSFPYLLVLKENPRIRKHVLKTEPHLLHVIGELAFNLARNNIRLSEKQKGDLFKIKKDLLALAGKKNTKNR